MKINPFANFIVSSLLGFALAVGITKTIERQTPPAPAAPQQPCATILNSEDKPVPVTQENWDSAYKAIGDQAALIQELMAQLKEARQNPAAQELARSGHVMNEAQCRAWIGVVVAPQPAATFSTVLYEAGRASVNISLLPLPGAPRIAVGAGSQLAPRWIIPGRIQPQMIGETRQAMYYYFDAQSSQWQGPFAPERVTQ